MIPFQYELYRKYPHLNLITRSGEPVSDLIYLESNDSPLLSGHVCDGSDDESSKILWNLDGSDSSSPGFRTPNDLFFTDTVTLYLVVIKTDRLPFVEISHTWYEESFLELIERDDCIDSNIVEFDTRSFLNLK